MPIAHLHVVAATAEQQRRLGAEATAVYAAALAAPVERIRVFVVSHEPSAVTVGGVNCADDGAPAPFFTALIFADRPVEQRHRVLGDLSRLVAEVMNVDLSLVRGQVIPVDPDNWAIGGEPASVLRRAEIDARAERK